MLSTRLRLHVAASVPVQPHNRSRDCTCSADVPVRSGLVDVIEYLCVTSRRRQWPAWLRDMDVRLNTPPVACDGWGCEAPRKTFYINGGSVFEIADQTNTIKNADMEPVSSLPSKKSSRLTTGVLSVVSGKAIDLIFSISAARLCKSTVDIL